MSNLYDLGEMILYLGPLRVPVDTRWVDRGTVMTVKGSSQLVGYPNLSNCNILIAYEIPKDTHPNLQAGFRHPGVLEKWSGLLCIGEETWEGDLRYDWATNELVSELSPC